MFEQKLINAAEKLHKKVLGFALKSLNKKMERVEQKMNDVEANAVELRQKALDILDQADRMVQNSFGVLTNDTLAIVALTNEIDNRIDDLKP